MKALAELLKESCIERFDYVTINASLKTEMRLCIGVWLKSGEYIALHRDQLEWHLVSRKFEDEINSDQIGLYKPVARIRIEENNEKICN